jgi:hypothetical protein
MLALAAMIIAFVGTRHNHFAFAGGRPDYLGTGARVRHRGGDQ